MRGRGRGACSVARRPGTPHAQHTALTQTLSHKLRPHFSFQAAAKAAATALTKHPGDAQLTALRAVAVQRLGHGDEAVNV